MRNSVMRVGTRVLAALALVLVAATAPLAHAADDEQAAEIDPAQVGAVVLTMLNGLDENDVERCQETISRLTKIAPEKRMGLLHAYVTVAGDSVHPFRRELMDIVLDELGASAVRELLREATSAGSSLMERTLALRLVRDRKISDAMEIVLDAAANEEAANLARPFVQRSIRESVAIVMKREPGSSDVVMQRFPRLRPEVQDAILDVLETRIDGFGTREMSRFLGNDARLNRAVLPRLVRLPITESEPLAPSASSHIAWSMQGADAPTRALAAHAAARFHLTTLVPDLMKLMDDDEPAVAAAAHRSLMRMTGAKLLRRKPLWETWLAGENEWREARLADALEAALSKEFDVARSGLQRLARHRLYRERFVARLARASTVPRADLRRLACETLGLLGSPRSIETLLLRLRDEDPAVVAAASAGLQRITGLRAPKVAADWPSSLRG